MPQWPRIASPVRSAPERGGGDFVTGFRMRGLAALDPGANPNDAGGVGQPPFAGTTATTRQPVDVADYVDIARFDPIVAFVRPAIRSGEPERPLGRLQRPSESFFRVICSRLKNRRIEP